MNGERLSGGEWRNCMLKKIGFEIQAVACVLGGLY